MKGLKIDKKSFGNRVKSIRKSVGLNQDELGKLMKNPARGENAANTAVVSGWERGMSVPGPYRLKVIADLGEITVDELLYGPLDAFIQQKAVEEIEAIVQRREKNKEQQLTPGIKQEWINKVINETSDNALQDNYLETASVIKKYVSLLDDFFELVGISVEEVSTAIKANNESSLELLSAISTYSKINSDSIESIRKHYDRIDDLLPKLEQ